LDLARELGGRPIVALSPPKRALPELAAILRAHTLIHLAEGELYRRAIVAAAEDEGWRVATPARPSLPDLPKPGPPWGKDQRAAAARAWSALATAAQG
jgi:hypothetical protein